jgi:hypothetical protein
MEKSPELSELSLNLATGFNQERRRAATSGGDCASRAAPGLSWETVDEPAQESLALRAFLVLLQTLSFSSKDNPVAMFDLVRAKSLADNEISP